MAAERLAGRVAANLPRLWEKAQPQAPGSYWPKLPDQQWKLDFSEGVDDILRRVRAFGSLECLAQVNQGLIFVRHAVGWHEAHAHKPGSVVYSNGRNIVMAARDGYIGIVEWSLIARNQMEQLGRT
jgi:methionyl-tRNA formyltransferase